MKKWGMVLLFGLLGFQSAKACSILYYVDTLTGKVYAVNNEDFWYDVKPYICIQPRTKSKHARLWYGWDNFAQGGINEAGLFFDGASTPDQPQITGYSKPKNNLGDEVLAYCGTVTEALAFLEEEKIALTNGHLLFGDKTGNAVVVEWVDGMRKIIPVREHHLLATNFLLSDPQQGNYPCPRYEAMKTGVQQLQQMADSTDLRTVGQIAARGVQVPATNSEGKTGGTLYSTFVNITDLEFVLIYKLDNVKITKLDLKQEFESGKKRKIKLK